MSRYRHPAMKQFADQQTRFARREHKIEQLVRAESLLIDVELNRDYPYQYVCFRITGYRPDLYPDLVLTGSDLAHDLPLFIEELSASAEIPVEEAGETVLTVEDLSGEFHISTKTVNRWRNRGLVSRRFLVDGRKRVGFLRSSVDRFVRSHADDVDRGARFSQLTEEEKGDIIERAKRLAAIPTATLAEVSRRIAKRLNRSPETVRYTIKNFDARHPDRAIFPTLRGALDADTKQRIYASYRRGAAIEKLAAQYRRTRSTIYRVINEMRATRLMGQPIDYIYNLTFDRANAENRICGDEPIPTDKPRIVRPPADLPPYLQSLYGLPLLTREQEQYLFRRMNYRLHQAKKLRAALDPARVRASDLDRLEAYLDDASDIKRRLIRSNLRLVVAVSKKHAYGGRNLFELISDGNVSLMRAVEKFDYGRGFKFSTYASWAIIKNFARTIPAENLHQDRFVTGHEVAFDLAPDKRANEFEAEISHERIASAVDKILDKLEERERQVIVYRYGLEKQAKPQTLEEVGSHFGVTKERIRQIEARAITKLRRFATDEKLDVAFLN